MAEKLSESSWTAFTRKAKLELEDKDLLKALARFDKTDEAKPQPRLDALKDLGEQIKKQVVALAKRKKELGDKYFNEVKDKLYDLLGLAESLQKETLARVEAAAAAAAEDEEADATVLLTTAMIPLVRQLMKGEVTMHGLIAVAGKKCAVLIMKRSISPTRRKLMAEYLQETGGIKYLKADCTGSSGHLEFALDTAPGGLARQLRLALFEQTGLRSKVSLWFDGKAAETDSDVEETPGAPALAQPQAQQATTPASPAPDAGAAFKARLIELLPKIKEAQASGSPTAQDVKLKASEAGVFAGKRDFERANALLDEAVTLLARPTPQVTPSAPATPAAPTPAPISPTVAFTQGRLVWDQTRKKVQSELRRLETAILAQCAEEPEAGAIADGAKNLYTLLERLDERLIDKLDEALNAADPARRRALHSEARSIVDEYLQFTANDPLMQDIDNNGFESTTIASSVNASLKLISNRLASAMAA